MVGNIFSIGYDMSFIDRAGLKMNNSYDPLRKSKKALGYDKGEYFG